METYTLTRDLQDDVGTFGNLTVGAKRYATVERPWHDNAPEISCVPPGLYFCYRRQATANKAAGLDVAYELQSVPYRSNIEIHVANYPSDVKGCIGLGMGRAFVGGRWMVSLSREAVRDFYAFTNGANFWLEIKNV